MVQLPLPKKINELADELRLMGRNPLVIPAGAECPLGTVGWINAAFEISEQLKDKKIDVTSVVLANGGGGTQAGLICGFKRLNMTMPIVGISVLNEKTEAINEVVRHGNEVASFLELDIAIALDDVTVYGDYIGPGYGVPTEACIEAIKLVARTEGIFLDPVYSGKAMHGLIDLIHKGFFTKKDTILFIHTGGVAADFAYSEELTGK